MIKLELAFIEHLLCARHKSFIYCPIQAQDNPLQEIVLTSFFMGEQMDGRVGFFLYFGKEIFSRSQKELVADSGDSCLT